jgi:LacI family transcriptional regulator
MPLPREISIGGGSFKSPAAKKLPTGRDKASWQGKCVCLGLAMTMRSSLNKRSINIHSVASAARVSTATVSRTLNGDNSVSPHLRQRVLKAAEELDYVRNSHAISLRSSRSKLLGLLISESICSSFIQLIRHFEDAAYLRGYDLLIGTVGTGSRGTDTLIRRMVERGADGAALLTNNVEQELVDYFARHNVRLLSLGQNREVSKQESVCLDMNIAAHQAVQHLAVLGHREIAFAHRHAPHPFLDIPASAFAAAMERIGAPIGNARIFEDSTNEIDDSTALLKWLSNSAPVTAIICSSDEMALKVLKAARDKGLDVPNQLSIIGFGDIYLARHSYPPLTTIQISLSDLAEYIVGRLSGVRSRPIFSRADDENISLTLISRQTTSFPRFSKLHRGSRMSV